MVIQPHPPLHTHTLIHKYKYIPKYTNEYTRTLYVVQCTVYVVHTYTYI